MSGVQQAVFQNLRSFGPSVPGDPGIGTATQTGATTATVAYTAPASDGGETITSYVATSSPGSITGTLSTAGSGTITVTGLTSGTTYTFTVHAVNSVGNSDESSASNGIYMFAAGDAYTSAGTFSWVAPAGVTSVSVVAVGGGSTAGGGGGGLGYKNNYTVVPTSSYTVRVGSGTASPGTDSYFVSTAVVKGGGGQNYPGTGGTYTGTGGGNGGHGSYTSGGSYYGGGGGAGGYSGTGGRGGGSAGDATAGSGGGGGGAYRVPYVEGGHGYGGGGVGIEGSGPSGAAGGGGGSGGSAGGYGGPPGYGGPGGSEGGGGGAGDLMGGNGGTGAVRIVYPGTTRSFPSTNVGDP